jgi:hypothetical protein
MDGKGIFPLPLHFEGHKRFLTEDNKGNEGEGGLSCSKPFGA